MFEAIAAIPKRVVLISTLATLFVATACSHASHKSDDPPPSLAVTNPLPTPEPGFSPEDVGLTNDQTQKTPPVHKAKAGKKVAKLKKKHKKIAQIARKEKKAKSLPVAAAASIEKPLPPPPAPPIVPDIAPLAPQTDVVDNSSGFSFWIWIAGGVALIGGAAYAIRRRMRRLPGRSRRQGKLIFTP